MDALQLVEMFIDADWKRSTSGNVFVRCPSPDHNDGSPSCHLSIEKRVFNCFSCGAKGTLATALRWRRAPESIINLVADLPASPFIGREQSESPLLDESLLYAYDHAPEPWIRAGFAPQLLAEHEIGFDILNNRVTIPVRNAEGGLVAIVGRNMVGDAKYKVYRSEFGEFEPRGYAPKVHDHLWRYHRLDPRDRGCVVVVEGYKAALHLVQSGCSATVALLGARISEAQIDLLSQLGRPVTLFLDNDEAGRRGQQDAEIKLYRKGLDVRTATYVSDVKQPDDLTPTEALDSVIYSKGLQWTS